MRSPIAIGDTEDPSRWVETFVVESWLEHLRQHAQCREDVLEADRIGDEEECALRDHLLLHHPKTVQPET